MKNRMIGPVLLLVGIGIGIGIGTLITKPKLDQAQQEVQQIQTQMELDKKNSEDIIAKAANRFIQKDNELKRATSMNAELMAQLSNVKRELDQYKTQQPLSPATSDSPTPVVMKTPTGTPAPPASAIEYTVQENDSLWKIAEAQLGNGIRFQEIISLNEGLTENTTLQKGMKLLIPAK